MGYAQQGPKAPWRGHALGYGPGVSTIGLYGCDLTTNADFATWAGHAITPDKLDEAFVAHGGIFQRDPTGTFDYLPDDCLARLWPQWFKWLGSWSGLRTDLIDKYLPSPDVFTALEIRANGVPMHFFPLVGGRGGAYTTDDSWDDVTRSIHAYAGLVVVKTIAVQALHPAPAAAPPKPDPGPVNPPVVAPDPLPARQDPGEPFAIYDFMVVAGDSPDLHPMAGAMQPSVAKTLANEWVADKPAGYRLDVVASYGLEDVTQGAGPHDRVVYTAEAPGVV
jgi:hypothetical protein